MPVLLLPERVGRRGRRGSGWSAGDRRDGVPWLWPSLATAGGEGEGVDVGDLRRAGWSRKVSEMRVERRKRETNFSR